MPQIPFARELLNQMAWQQGLYNRLGQAAYIRIGQAQGILKVKALDEATALTLPAGAEHRGSPRSRPRLRSKYVAVYVKGLDDLISLIAHKPAVEEATRAKEAAIVDRENILAEKINEKAIFETEIGYHKGKTRYGSIREN
jgi:hypothetical protein